MQDFLRADGENYAARNSGLLRRLKNSVTCAPNSDQTKIWDYIRTLRYVEHHSRCGHRIRYYLVLRKLRKLAWATGFQIPAGTCGKGLTIWHWGSIVINANARLGEYCTLHPGVLIGHKEAGGPAPVIGDHVFIGSGAKIIGPVRIGSHVTIAPGAVVVKDVPDNAIVAGVPGKIIGTNP